MHIYCKYVNVKYYITGVLHVFDRTWAEWTLHLEKQHFFLEQFSQLGSGVLVKFVAVVCNAKERSLIASTCALTGSGKAAQHMLCLYFKVEFLLNFNFHHFHLFLQTCPIKLNMNSTILRWHVPVLALCRWLTLGLSSRFGVSPMASHGLRIVSPLRIWDANEPTFFVAHSYDFVINGNVSLCGRSYQKSATCLRFIEIYDRFSMILIYGFSFLLWSKQRELGTNYGAINELQVCLVLHDSSSFQSCDCCKICRIVL